MRAESRTGHGLWFTVALCSVVLTTAGTVRAQTSADELAHKHFESGAAYLEQADYDSSLREFQAAYDLSKRPEILINVATVDERLGRLPDAVAALEKYLAEAPADDRAETIKIRIENLKKRIAEQPAAAPAPEAAPKTEAAPAPAPAPAAPPAATQPTPPAPAEHHRDRTAPIVLLAGGGALGVASLVTGLMAEHEHSKAKSSCSPNCTDSQLSTGRTLAVTSTVLTGAAVVAGAIGAVLWFGGGEETESAGKPSAFVGITPSGVAAGSRWRFF